MAALQVRTTMSFGIVRAATATPVRAMPYAAKRSSPRRRRRVPVLRPTAIEPVPWATWRRPVYAGEWPRDSTTA